MVNLYDLIQNIHKRPAMYLGRTSIANLRASLSGYCAPMRQPISDLNYRIYQYINFQKYFVPPHKYFTNISYFVVVKQRSD
jgi:hypothetical protein